MGLFLINSFGINKIIGSLFITAVSYIIFLNNIKSVTRVNSIVIPILIIIILIIGLKNIVHMDLEVLNIKLYKEKNFFWIVEAIIYASYNLILLIPVLINIGVFIKSKEEITIISVISRNNN